jgi:hypothetical protein
MEATNTPPPPTDLQSLIDYIHGLYQFTSGNYPALTHLPESLAAAFIGSHSLLHMQKSLGILATHFEAADHSGKPPLPEQYREALLKLILNCLKLAAEMGLSANDIVTGIPPLMKSKPQPVSA